jgi:hypothetical protein
VNLMTGPADEFCSVNFILAQFERDTTNVSNLIFRVPFLVFASAPASDDQARKDDEDVLAADEAFRHSGFL